MNREHQELENDMALVRNTIVKPFYWLTIGFALLMILPKFSTFPDYGVTYWHVFAVIIVGCVAQAAGHRWVSRRFDRAMKQHYPELFTKNQDAKNSCDT